MKEFNFVCERLLDFAMVIVILCFVPVMLIVIFVLIMALLIALIVPYFLYKKMQGLNAPAYLFRVVQL